ncbi:MAG: hypothetical protein JEZ00_20495 [Anaerolineaceae bacterium]|nr:hypothetical protein [Anaerolineaceae bacterium]
MILKSVFMLSPAFLLGIIFVFWFLPTNVNKNILFKLILGAMVGSGLRSVLFFFWMFVFPEQPAMYVWFEIFLIIIFLILFIKKVGQGWKSIWPFKLNCIKALDIYTIAFFVLLLINTIAFFAFSFMKPMGNFDAYAIWEFKAKMIFLNPHDWQNALNHPAVAFFHPDYPLLIPMLVSNVWFMIGEITTRTPIIVAGFYTLALPVLIFTSLRYFRDSSQALLGSILLFGAPYLFHFGTGQTAELPLAGNVLTAIILIFLAWHSKQWQFAFLGGLMAGFAAWTKNEGLLYFLVLSIGFVFISLARFKRKGIRQLAAWLAGICLPLFAVLVFKFGHETTSEYLSVSPIDFILDFDRYGLIVKEMVLQLLKWGGWAQPWLLFYIIYAVLMRRLVNDTNKWQLRFVFGFIVVILAGFFFIYLITPYPLMWQLTYSLDRLLFQLFPVFILGIMLYTKSIHEIRKQPEQSD